MHFLPLVLISLTYFRHVSAWSGLGHCTVGYIAEALFTDAASNLVNDILQPNDKFDICDAATWADKVRETAEFAHTASWHFIGTSSLVAYRPKPPTEF
jgi:hypothetical protein